MGGWGGGDRGHEKTSSAPDSSASPKKEATFPSPSPTRRCETLSSNGSEWVMSAPIVLIMRTRGHYLKTMRVYESERDVLQSM